MVREPRVFLMDAPLSNLDAKLRVSMRGNLARLHERLGVTTISVTHDQVEAMTLGQRVAVMRDGVVQQVDTPQRLFNAPANLFVAAFMGSPSMNLVEAEVDGGAVHFAGFTLPLPPGVSLAARRVILGIRPTDFRRARDAAPSQPRLRVRADVVEELGAESHVLFRVDAPRVDTDAVRAAADRTPDEEALLAAAGAGFAARIEGYDPVPPGTELELAVDTARLHFFDTDDGTVVGQ